MVRQTANQYQHPFSQTQVHVPVDELCSVSYTGCLGYLCMSKRLDATKKQNLSPSKLRVQFQYPENAWIPMNTMSCITRTCIHYTDSIQDYKHLS